MNSILTQPHYLALQNFNPALAAAAAAACYPPPAALFPKPPVPQHHLTPEEVLAAPPQASEDPRAGGRWGAGRPQSDPRGKGPVGSIPRARH
ncbi:hypothetical protein CEXT_595031 [Caerostris extrusa]|uniref:Uncharacterized protein n=1 Tax=Caerostris extrusa TaxID=172846 RepID=A0AAV4QND2_CAEEX|nr:hypothetical protein CEXT_595031 [Caerostris extrusa]